MIEPQVHNNQRGVIGQQHGLQKLTETLEALTKGQSTQQQRDTAIQAQLTDQATRLVNVNQWLRYQLYSLLGLAVLVLTLSGLVGWQWLHPPDMGYARALGALDTALVQQWSALPKGSQEALADTYRRMGLLPPSQRK